MSDGNTIRTFEFGALEVTENDSDIGLAHEDLGEIEICLSSVSRLVRNKKKGLTHSIQLGEEKEYDGPELDSVKYVGCADVCSFQFWYRSMETLIADGKAPGRNPPVPVASSLSNASRESSHLAEAVRNRNEHPPDEDEGLEYVTPEPAPQQNQHTSTVPNVNPASHKRTSGC
ncbi:hypothetical protein FA13DRAFT_153139 [Coprinellus micaceus]|uniref:Uncharacterized protein n=1 Tax=Coprinellus micaceus TaxID=71717 RepID=A0A4Y7TGY7_COPMI|nr:hypothetical protein FA13DRAFT_153139 [Coprinellus micaceus]